MLSSTDAWLAAQGMMIAQGHGAVRECETIVAKMIAHGDAEGAQNWTSVLAAIRKTQKQADSRNASALQAASVASACE
jgi:hypothetical protein